jgi:hypothetical protein
VDKIKGIIGNSQTMLQYTYALNNPLMYVDRTGLEAVLLRDWIESRHGVVTPNYTTTTTWGWRWPPRQTTTTLTSITVSLPGQKPVTYTSSDYTIKSAGKAIIDDSILNRDFSTTGVYFMLINAYCERGTDGKKARNWMAGLYPNEFNPRNRVERADGNRDTWCITFVSWALDQAGLPSPKAYNCANAIQWYKDRGKDSNGNYTHYATVAGGGTPRVGDTAFIGTSHATIVIAFVPPDMVYTIEGNSGNNEQVLVRKRKLSDFTGGIGRNGGVGNGFPPPNYNDANGTLHNT